MGYGGLIKSKMK